MLFIVETLRVIQFYWTSYINKIQTYVQNFLRWKPNFDGKAVKTLNKNKFENITEYTDWTLTVQVIFDAGVVHQKDFVEELRRRPGQH